jgi:hypothetical protein
MTGRAIKAQPQGGTPEYSPKRIAIIDLLYDSNLVAI